MDNKIRFRLLEDGEVVLATDEYLSDDCTYWLKAQEFGAGSVYKSSRDMPCRRKIDDMD